MRRVVFAIVSLMVLSACGGSSDHPIKDRSAAVLEGTLWDDSSAGCKNTAERLQAADYVLKQLEDEREASVAYYKRAYAYLILANRECFSKAQVSSAQERFNAIPSKTLKADLAAGEQ